jgi:hypothetical protein
MAQQVLDTVYVRRVRLLGPDHVDTIEALHQLGLSVETTG